MDFSHSPTVLGMFFYLPNHVVLNYYFVVSFQDNYYWGLNVLGPIKPKILKKKKHIDFNVQIVS